MLIHVIGRLAGLAPVLLAVSLVVFGFAHLLPGDPAHLLAGPDASPTDIAALRAALGLDAPLWQQYLSYLGNVIRGDFGLSLRTRQPVAEELAARYLPTFWLTLVSMLWALLAGLTLGLVAAVRRGRAADRGAMVLAVSGVSLPAFWFGLLLMDVVAVRLGWLPTGGYGTAAHFVLPSLTLGVGVAAVMARFSRSALLETAREDYVRTARAKGIGERLVVWRHMLRNALLPILTMAGLQFGFLLGGSIVVESVFAWPGVGRLLVDAVVARDYPVIQATVLLFSLQFLLINLVVDLLYAWANPEIRYR